MPEARHPTVAQRVVERVAFAALSSDEGVTMRFMVKDHGSLEACQALARSFQQTFSSVRHRARRVSGKLLGEDKSQPRDGMAQGMYDVLSCQRLPLPNGAGWSVLLARASVFLAGFDIIDNATGLPLADIGRERDEKARLVEKFGQSLQKINTGPRLTEAEILRLEELEPGIIEDYGEGKYTLPAREPVLAPSSFDPNNTTEEDMEAWVTKK